MTVIKKKKAKQVRRSVSLSADVHRRVERLAQAQKRSASRVLENLIETGLEAEEAEKRRFFEVADRLQKATDEAEIRQLKNELARMTFGN